MLCVCRKQNDLMNVKMKMGRRKESPREVRWKGIVNVMNKCRDEKPEEKKRREKTKKQAKRATISKIHKFIAGGSVGGEGMTEENVVNW